MDLVMVYFECICEISLKYRVSFRLDKCEFLRSRVEYVGHDILCQENCPAQSKFDMVNDWPLPELGQSLTSFIGLVNFYHKYAPYMEMCLKLLRKLVKAYYRNPTPSSACTPEFVKLFSDLKSCITSSSALARFDPANPTFLKMDWSSKGMGWILMQPADDEESKTAMAHLRCTRKYLFDLLLKGARLKPI